MKSALLPRALVSRSAALTRAFSLVLALAFALAPAFSPALRAQEPRLVNLSTLTRVGTGSDILTVGFYIEGTTPKQVVIRAIGPTLGLPAPAGFGVPGALANPQLSIFAAGSTTALATNDNWSTPVAPQTSTAAQLSAAFTAVGAFALPANSLDAAILTTLQPGSYTAQVSGVGNTTGTAIVEVYEVGTTAATRAGKFLNLSTRAQVGGAAGVLSPGFVITSGGSRRLLIRAAGPTLGAAPPTGFGLPGVLANPQLSVVRNTAGGTLVARNDNWSTPIAPQTTTAAQFSAAFTAAGAFAFPANSQDAALLVDLPAGDYTIQVSGVNNVAGLALVEVYDVTPSGPVAVTLAATRATANETGTQIGEFVFTRAGETLVPLTVYYAVSGSASNGIDYPALLGSVVIPAGSSSYTLTLQASPDTTIEPNETVTLTLDPVGNYTIGAQNSGTVTISDNPGTLYVSTLRPAASAAGSAGSGLATIVLSASGTTATINISFSNLSSAQTATHLYLGSAAAPGDYLLNLGVGQVNGVQWTIRPTANYTTAQIIDALRSGQIYVSLETAQNPGGELRGAFLAANGSQNFTAPAAPPAVTLANLSATEAARLLTQATFGPKPADLDALTGGNVNTWLDQQFALPATPHRAATVAERNAALATTPPEFDATANPILLSHRQRAWFQIALNAPDQLRQRVAFALSQILVVSDVGFGNNLSEATARYYDLLVDGAFGNYRTLLEQVTLSPVMGLYLSHLRNAKADTTTGTNPDENYAREVMQLFSIGLVQLQPDGTLRLDEQGLPIPTYDQTTITQMARVFTGWGFHNTTANATNSLTQFRRGSNDYITPMMLFAVAHEPGSKDIRPVLDTAIPASLGGTEDLRRTLDALFNHANTPAFVSKQLIQRLVTDNPSPAYVYRVAEKFRNNGANVRGDLGAVVRAILTDYEARAAAVADDPGYGKLREPLLRYTALLRAFNAASTSGRNLQDNVQTSLAQAALRAPSVFNFFEPGYVLPGPLAAAGLVAPEFQITDDTTAISVPNFLRNAVFATAAGANAAKVLVPNYTAELALASTPAALVARLNLLLAANQLTPEARTRIQNVLTALPTATSALERVQTAVLLTVTSPDAATQR